MITINYKCDETEQEFTLEFEVRKKAESKVNINFNPPISDDSKDPYGLIEKILIAVGLTENQEITEG